MSNDEDEVMIVSESPSTMSRSCSLSSVRMREVRVSLTDCRRSSSSPGTESPRSPAKVPTPLSASKRGRGRPRKSLPTPDTLKITSPSPKCKITNYFKANVYLLKGSRQCIFTCKKTTSLKNSNQVHLVEDFFTFKCDKIIPCEYHRP